ncbi:MAG: hypothetical protein EOM74_01050 [Methanomicrobia archaeon]|nr:hypothetical protein [Methanomicrobia archaeon]
MQATSKHLDDYYAMFGEFPPTYMTLSPVNPVYVELVKKAIKRKKKLTSEEIGEVLEVDEIGSGK